MYNAIAGSCAEDEANAGGGGGGGGGGSPPVGITPPSQIYTAESNGGSVGIIIEMYATNFIQFLLNGFNPTIIPALSGTATNSASITATNLTLIGQPFAVSVETTISATSFNSIMNSGFTGGNPCDTLFPAIGFFLMSPNGTPSNLDYRILAVQSNITNVNVKWGGNPAAAPFNQGYTGNNWPLQDSTDFTNGNLLSFFPTSFGTTGGLGAHGTLTSGNMQQPQGVTFSEIVMLNMAGRGGGTVNANTGEFMRIIYEFEAQVGGVTETTMAEYRLTLS